MKYDFDTVYNRREADPVKWKVGENELPMWVADMDFKTVPEILKALSARVEHGIFGYCSVTDEWYSAYADWWRLRYGFVMDKSALAFCSGVVSAVSASIAALTEKGDGVVLMTPVYNAFFNCVKNNGCRVVENPLIYKDGAYSADLDGLDKKLSDPSVKALILCNPHNPVGIIWDKETLYEIGKLCKKHGVTVITDEIHCDITRPGMKYVPFLSVSDEFADGCVMCVAPTKSFNLAGLHTSAVYIPNEDLRNKVRASMRARGCDEATSFSVPGAVSAYKYGAEWLDQMREYVFENRKIAEERIDKAGAEAIKGDATYLLWIDFGERGKGIDLSGFVRQKTGLFLNAGTSYGCSGDGFLRMNLACPRKTLYDGLERLENAIRELRR